MKLICMERLGHSAARRAAVREADGDNWWEDGDKCCMFPLSLIIIPRDPDPSEKSCGVHLMNCAASNYSQWGLLGCKAPNNIYICLYISPNYYKKKEVPPG